MAFQFVITPGYTFAPSEAVTYSKLNKMMSLAYATVLSGTLDTAQIGDLQVTAAKLASTLDLSGNTITLPTSLRPQTGITPTTTVPNFIGQWGVTASGVWYVATGTSAGNWKSMNCLLIETQWNADDTNFPEKTLASDSDWLLMEDSLASYAKKKIRVANLLGSIPKKYIHNLTLGVDGAAKKVYIAYGEVAVTNLSNLTKVLTGDEFSVPIDLTTTGALGLDIGTLQSSTWYNIYVIAKADGTRSALASTASTPGNVVLPSGYTYLRKVGEVYIDAGGTPISYSSFGSTHTFYIPQPFYSGSMTTTWSTPGLPGGIPNLFGVVYHLTGGTTAYNIATRQMVGADDAGALYVPVDSPLHPSYIPSYTAAYACYNTVNFDLQGRAEGIWHRSGSTVTEANQVLLIRGYTYVY